MMEEYFFGHWSKRRPALPQIYLPIGWSTYFFSAARVTFNSSEVARAKLQVTCLGGFATFCHDAAKVLLLGTSKGACFWVRYQGIAVMYSLGYCIWVHPQGLISVHNFRVLLLSEIQGIAVG